MTYCGCTKSCTTLKPCLKPLFVLVFSGESNHSTQFLRWWIWSTHIQWEHAFTGSEHRPRRIRLVACTDRPRGGGGLSGLPAFRTTGCLVGGRGFGHPGGGGGVWTLALGFESFQVAFWPTLSRPGPLESETPEGPT